VESITIEKGCQITVKPDYLQVWHGHNFSDVHQENIRSLTICSGETLFGHYTFRCTGIYLKKHETKLTWYLRIFGKKETLFYFELKLGESEGVESMRIVSADLMRQEVMQEHEITSLSIHCLK